MDISDRSEINTPQETFTELIISEDQLQAIIDTDPAFTRRGLPDRSKESLNERWHEYTGLSPEAAHGPGWKMVLRSDDLDRLLSKWQGILASKRSGEIEVRIRRVGGDYRWFLIRALPKFAAESNIINFCGSNTGIEERKRAEDKIQHENLVLREEIERSSMFEEIVGSSEPVRQVVQQVVKVAASDATVLILGETGTGKELLARAIHRRSKRAAMPFIRVNCAAIPQSLIASELFGHEKGAFTGALQQRIGRFESADGGTLFLDEIGDLPPETQIALLRVLQEREFERVGGNRPISVDVRMIAATNRDLREAIAAKAFRQDLFYRLNVFPIQIPSLRERVEDIPRSSSILLSATGSEPARRSSALETTHSSYSKRTTGQATFVNCRTSWNGGVILCESETFDIDESWLKREPTPLPTVAGPLAALTEGEREVIEAALERSQGRISGLRSHCTALDSAADSRVKNQKPRYQQTSLWEALKLTLLDTVGQRGLLAQIFSPQTCTTTYSWLPGNEDHERTP
jgi:formate hydrogenlyase transcriptional activator